MLFWLGLLAAGALVFALLGWLALAAGDALKRAKHEALRREEEVVLDRAPPDFGRPAFDGEELAPDEEDERRGFRLPPKLADNLGWRLAIVYIDGEGARTSRIISIDGAYGRHVAEPEYVTAWCHARRARRTFACDRVLNFGAFKDGATDVDLESPRPAFSAWLGASIAARRPLPL